MNRKEAIDVIKSECYVFNPLNFDRSTMINTALDMAIKALKQESCEDAVSREAVLAIAGDSCLDLDNYEDTKEFCDEIKELPSVTPVPKENKWIPCSKKMPKQNEYVDHVCKYYIVQDEYEDMYVAHYTNIGWIPIDSLYAIETKVVAWMPLPKEYKAETEDDT